MALRFEFPTERTFANPDATGQPAKSQSIVVKNDNNETVLTLTDDGDGNVSLSLPGTLTITGDLSVSGVSQIFTASEHIADPEGAATDQDDEARAAIASILDVLEAQGLMEAEPEE